MSLRVSFFVKRPALPLSPASWRRAYSVATSTSCVGEGSGSGTAPIVTGVHYGSVSGTVGIGLLTLVPGRVGGSETYARELTRALARVGELEYRVFLPAIAADA